MPHEGSPAQAQMSGASAFRYQRHQAADGAYRVELRDGQVLGYVRAVWLPSHIRRGRSQATPWWVAACLQGHSVQQDGTVAKHRPSGPAGQWVTRERAARRLREHTEDAHEGAA